MRFHSMKPSKTSDRVNSRLFELQRASITSVLLLWLDAFKVEYHKGNSTSNSYYYPRNKRGF